MALYCNLSCLIVTVGLHAATAVRVDIRSSQFPLPGSPHEGVAGRWCASASATALALASASATAPASAYQNPYGIGIGIGIPTQLAGVNHIRTVHSRRRIRPRAHERARRCKATRRHCTASVGSFRTAPSVRRLGQSNDETHCPLPPCHVAGRDLTSR